MFAAPAKKEERNNRERNTLKGHCAELDLDFKLGDSLPLIDGKWNMKLFLITISVQYL